MQDILPVEGELQMNQATIRRRLTTLREARKSTQAELAGVLGFNDRQTLSDIESGKRLIAFAELSKAANHFGVNIDYFTDPLQLAGEARFSWRKLPTADNNLAAFEELAGGWIATYRHLCRLKGESVNSSLTRVGLTAKSSYEEAWDQGDAVSRTLELGEVPASKLFQALEEKLDTLVLYVDTVAGISGACSQLGPLNAIIINRREAEGRRNFDLAHELFHLLTWEEMAPQRIEDGTQGGKYKRIESLADNFAAGLLMPTQSIASYIETHPLPISEAELAGWIRDAAIHYRMSGEAMMWRLKCLTYIKGTTAKRLTAAEVRVELPSNGDRIPRFSRRFVETVGWGIEAGHLSVRRAAQVIGVTVDDLADLFTEHGQKTPFDL